MRHRGTVGVARRAVRAADVVSDTAGAARGCGGHAGGAGAAGGVPGIARGFSGGAAGDGSERDGDRSRRCGCSTPTPAQSPIEGEGEGALACEIQRPARNVSPPRFSAPSAVVPAALTVQFPGMTGTGVLAARLGSGVRRNDEQNQRLARTLWPPQLAPPEGGFQKLGREWWGFARALCYDIVMIFAGAIPLELHPTSRARSAPARRRGRALWRRR